MAYERPQDLRIYTAILAISNETERNEQLQEFWRFLSYYEEWSERTAI